MARHELKTWPEYFQPMKRGEKNFDIRWDDRGFRVGDTLHLREFDPNLNGYTGDHLNRRVLYILRGQVVEQFGLKPGWCVMSVTEA